MHELICPGCNTASQFNFADYLLLCPFCSATFKLDTLSGQKEIFPDHYIVPNTMDAATVKSLALEWLKRLHHKPSLVEKEFFVTDIQGLSMPLWVVSLEGHTTWKGLVQKNRKSNMEWLSGKGDYLIESGQFRRSYRWAVLARNNICETWGFARLHEPHESIKVEWDGFPLDSTLSRGKLFEENPKSAYDQRKYFEFKYANGLPILGVQVADEEALRRSKAHVQLFHYKMSGLNVDYLLDHRTELEIAGIQLIHVPFWRVNYIYRPKTMLRHFFKSKDKQILISGYDRGVLVGELAILYKDKITVNAIICTIGTILFFILGGIWHPAFYLVGLFSAFIAAASIYSGVNKKSREEYERLAATSNKFGESATPLAKA